MISSTISQNIEQQLKLDTTGERVKVYGYQITPGQPLHIGNAFMFAMVDNLVQYLTYRGHQVIHIQPIVALPEDGAVNAKMAEWRTSFFEQMQALHLKPPTKIEWVSDDAQKGKSSLPDDYFSIKTKSILVTDLLKTYSADVLRLYLAQYTNEASWEYDAIGLEKAAKRVEKLSAAITAVSTGTKSINLDPIRHRFIAAMDNKMNTTKGIGTLLNLADEIIFRAWNGYHVNKAQQLLQQMASVFGIQLNNDLIKHRVTPNQVRHQQQIRESE